MTINLIPALNYLPQTNYRTLGPEHLNGLGVMDMNAAAALFNEATYSCVEAVGITPAYMLTKGRGIWSIKSFAQSFGEIITGQTIGIYSRFIGYSRKRLHLMHFMVIEPMGYLVATYEDLIVHVDRQAQISTLWTDSTMHQIIDFVKSHQTLDWEAPICGILHPF